MKVFEPSDYDADKTEKRTSFADPRWTFQGFFGWLHPNTDNEQPAIRVRVEKGGKFCRQSPTMSLEIFAVALEIASKSPGFIAELRELPEIQRLRDAADQLSDLLS